MAFPSVYEMMNPLTTVRKQHFWEYFSGAGVSFTTESAYNYTGGSENSGNIYGGSSTEMYGQKLDSGHSGIGKVIVKVDTPVKKYGSPTGTATIRVYAGDGTTILAESSGLDVSTLTTSYVNKTFVLSSHATLETNSRVVIYYSGGDSSNYINIGVGDVGGAGSNTSSTRWDGSNWASPTTRDTKMTFDSSATTYTLPSSRWTATKVNPPASFAMNDSIDGGFRITADGGANNEGMINFNNKRAFSKTGSVCIWVGRDVQTSSYTGYYGLANGITGNDSDMGQLATIYNTSANGVIALRTGNTTKGNTESTISLDTNFHNYKIEMKTSSAEWSVDGVAQTARTSTLPTLDLQPVAGVHGNNKSIDVKYCEVYNT